jgi:hypothetical protein
MSLAKVKNHPNGENSSNLVTLFVEEEAGQIEIPRNEK